jgi:predicted ATP-grasp superfamily ATP-dependent carboligase
VWLPSLKSFDITTNKLKLNLFCVEHKVIVPKSYVIKLSNNSTFNFNNINYPVLIKPLRSEGGGGIVRLDSQLLLVKFVKDSLKKDLFIQEYVTGYDIDCSVFCLNGKILVYTIQQGNFQASTPYKQQLGVSFFDSDEVLLEVTNLMKALDWSGIAHLDLRYDQKANNYKVIEINARFWGSLLASLNVSVNSPKLLIEQTLGKPIIFQNYRKESYLQLKGLSKLLKQNPLMLFKLKLISTNTDLKYVFKDSLPAFYKIFYWFQRKFD